MKLVEYLNKIGLCLSMLLLLGNTLAQTRIYTVETVPNPKNSGGGYTSDPDTYLSATELVEINNLIGEIEASTTAQIAVVLLNTIGEDNPKEFATRLFEKWGIGQSDKDNGLLILSIMDQRRTEFETGYGMEAVLTDIQCYRIGMQELVPYFKQDEYGQGVLAALRRIKLILEDPEAAADIYSERAREGPKGLFPFIPFPLEIYLYVLTLFLATLFIRFLFVWYSKQDLYDKYMGLRSMKAILFIFLFPLPYLFIYFLLGKLLDWLRDHPRYSKKNGALMRKLEEEEDDKFLEQGEITEEEIGSVDYDVWVTEGLDDILILRYKKPFSKYNSCPKCNFQTYYLAHTRTVRYATYSHSGKKEIIHECKNCGYHARTFVTIPRKTRSSGGSSSRGGGGGSWGGGSSGGGGAGVSW